MFLYRKNIILVPSNYDGVSLTKGLLSFDCFDTKTKCTLHCYNLYEDKPLTLGVAIGKDLHKMVLDAGKAKNVQFEIDRVIKNRDEISCVLLDVREHNYAIVLWGSTQISSGWKTSIEMMLQDEILPKVNKENIACNKKTNIDNSEHDIKEEFFNTSKPKKFEDEQFENVSNNTFVGSQNKNVFEQKEFENNQKTNYEDSVIHAYSDSKSYDVEKNMEEEIYTYDDEKINDFIDKVIDMTEERPKENISNVDTDSLSFYQRITPQIDKMFAFGKEETVLNEIIPNSKFCKVNFDDGTGYYVFGIIYDDGKPKYLCYGIPAKKDSQPPKELANLYQWLPLDTEEEDGNGFYMMYQDAMTGKNISVEVV